jgi:predicted DsbA family dithiol-disulfide isomerase
MVVPVAHDFTCGWCWIGWFQTRQLIHELPGLEFEWRAYELYPEEDAWPEPAPAVAEVVSNRPKTPTRMELAYAAQGMDVPAAARARRQRTRIAHEAVEFLKHLPQNPAELLIERIYRAHWEQGREIGSLDTIAELAQDLVPDLDELRCSVQDRRFRDRIVAYDAPAYESGVYNVPTFWIGGQRYAEQPITVLRAALREAL